ncbi:hypothetical protein [Aquimarina pacifica]|uniref:hypothetical protein n=1 Tax=Aquimarina pacifica TaxID=1296415 RepID=UPI00046E619C|nr:hypothetical protein [Aquimarina pacifica]
MIFYNNQLMTSPQEAILYMVTHPEPFTRYKDHEAAIYLKLHQLIAQAFEEGEDPIALIEGYLEISYTDGDSVEEIASFLIQTDVMVNNLWALQHYWEDMDQSLPADSKMFGGLPKEDVTRLYSEITLRSYLEALLDQRH